MHEDNFGEINCNKILKEAELLKAETGCTRCMVVLDHIGKLRVPASVEKSGQLEAEKWQMEEALKIREWLAGDPVLAAVEIRKGKQGGKSDDPVSSEDIMGSSRRAYDADNILIWNRFSDALLYGNFGYADGQVFNLDTAWEDVDEKELKKPEVKRAIRNIRNTLENELSTVPGRITIDKVRDGGRKGIFDITVLFKQNRIIEGIHGENTF
jgi:phage FluMu protein Com